MVQHSAPPPHVGTWRPVRYICPSARRAAGGVSPVMCITSVRMTPHPLQMSIRFLCLSTHLVVAPCCSTHNWFNSPIVGPGSKVGVSTQHLQGGGIMQMTVLCAMVVHALQPSHGFSSPKSHCPVLLCVNHPRQVWLRNTSSV